MNENEDAKPQTFTDNKGVQYPLYPFDVPVSVTLQNGTIHNFKLSNEAIERKREDLQKTVVLTSPAVINGENPRDVKTDFTRSVLRYYDMLIDTVSGVRMAGYEPTDVIPAKQAVEGLFQADGVTPIRVMDMIGAPVRKAAAIRVYGGKIDIERPGEDEEDADVTGDEMFEDVDITLAVERAEKPREIYTLSLNRDIIVRHEVGVETLRSGKITDPTHIMRHHFREPDGDDFSRWELKAYRGFAVSRPKGGQRAEQYYNLDTMNRLYDSLIEKIEGASINGQPIELSPNREDSQRKALLAQVPLAIKKMTVTNLFQELSNLGNF